MSRRRWWSSSAGDADPPEWQEEFPYRNDFADAVTRRHFLTISVLTSGALFAGTVVFALLGRRDDRRRGEPQPIAGAADLAPGEALYFEYPEEGAQAMLLNLPEHGLVAFSQKCTHLACSVYYQPEEDRLFCPCHDGVFDPATGEVLAGPPQRPLPRIVLEQRDDGLYAVEERP